MAEVCFCDGQAYAASDFGEFDEDSPTIWKPKKVSTLTFGSNGFYLDFEDSDNLGDDESGNTNDLTETNLAAADQATDTPTNNFATLNSLEVVLSASGATLAEGNLKSSMAATGYYGIHSTFGASNGKWYAEFKATSHASGTAWYHIGVQADQLKEGTWGTGHAVGSAASAYAYVGGDGNKYYEGSNASYGNTYDAGDIIGIALDLTNNKLYFAKNGTWQNSGDPTSGATGTGAISITDPASTSLGAYLFACGKASNTVAFVIEANFGGCPAFSISSGNADGNGYGNFEYAPPSGYLALCTKNLGSDGG